MSYRTYRIFFPLPGDNGQGPGNGEISRERTREKEEGNGVDGISGEVDGKLYIINI